MAVFTSLSQQSAFFMPCDDTNVIDGTESEAMIKHINHTCVPTSNCHSKTMTYRKNRQQTKEVVIVTSRNLLPDDPLTIAYSKLHQNFSETIKCDCAACKNRKNVTFV